jgi:heat-inducible transcriptional repressor
MALDDRKLEVLRAIVEDYVATREPVGSKALVDRHHLHVSSATVRNDMAVLEEEGYIVQPHTSAGRIPTDKGYRLFVDRLSAIKPLSPAERRAITSFLEGAVDLDQIVSRSVRLLAQLTRQVAVVQYPSLSRARVRHVELVGMADTRLLVVVIGETGRIDQRVVDTPAAGDEHLVGGLRLAVNEATVGRAPAEATAGLERLPERFAPHEQPVVSAVLAVILEILAGQHEERLAVAGTANVTAYGADFEHGVRPLLEALEEHVVLLTLLGEAVSPATLTVRIGRENPPELAATSVVAAGYGPGDELLGTLGVLGPTRMDYPSTMTTVRAVARYLSRVLAE